MATATMTETKANVENDDSRPTDHHRATTRARYVGPPAVDAKGNTIPHSKRWGYSSHAFQNGEARSTAFLLLLMSTFSALNQTQTAHDMYDYLDSHYSLFQVNFFLTFAVSFTWYWALAGVFAFVDLTGRPRWLFKYKVQPFQRVDGREYMHIAGVVLRNFIVVVIPLIYARAKLTPGRVASRYVEGPMLTMANLLINVLCTEIGFYFIHRFFHTPFMYQRWHKQHHRLTAPVALAATYCTMTEHIFSNLLPNAIGTGIMKPHWSVQMFTFILLTTSTLCAHSGYNIPFLFSSLQHDWHHFAFNENYGPTGILDALFGTARRYHLALDDGVKRNKGDADKARDELLSKLAAWEAAADDRQGQQ